MLSRSAPFHRVPLSGTSAAATHTCTFSCGLQNGIILADRQQSNWLAASSIWAHTEAEMLKCCLAIKRESPKHDGCKWIAQVFLSVHGIWKACTKSFQQFDLFEDSVLAKFLMRPGSTICAHDASLLCPWIYSWNARQKPHQSDGLNFSSADSVLWEVCKHNMQRSGLWMEEKAIVISVVPYS